MQQHFANLFSGRSAAWFAGHGDREAVGAQGACQFFELRALAAAIETFKGDKFSARGHVGNDSRSHTWPMSAFAKVKADLDYLLYSAAVPLYGDGRMTLGGTMDSRFGSKELSFLAFVLLLSLSALAANGPSVTLAVDASDAPRKMIHAQLRIPAKPGTLTLYYPKWIPGEHGPTGPITDLTGLKFTANGKTLSWRRDLLDGFTFHVEVPAGIDRSHCESRLCFAGIVRAGLQRRNGRDRKVVYRQLEYAAALSGRIQFR